MNNNRICPICGNIQHIFETYNNRKNARCSKCKSLERQRFLWIYMSRIIDLNKKINLIHFAPSDSINIYISKKYSNISYMPCDINPERYSSNGTPVLKNDITNISYGDDMCDMILCSHVLEHIPNHLLALKELFRVLKPDGILLIMLPINNDTSKKTHEDLTYTAEQRLNIYGIEDHYRLYGNDTTDILSSVGFNVVEEISSNILSPDEINMYGLSNDIIFKCVKSDEGCNYV